jgi:2,3-bisphosphoglycerate-dependent phosphoglycerate mutase
MKKILLTVFVFALFSACTSNKVTRYYLIRHAEKDRTNTTNKNPNLNSDGVLRAEKWAKYFEKIELDAVYSSDYKRTQQTAIPAAKSKGLIVQLYNPSKMYDSIFKKNTKGKTVLVVGHSNTTPVFANTILGQKKYKNMADNDNASLYIVTLVNDKKFSEIKKVN